MKARETTRAGPAHTTPPPEFIAQRDASSDGCTAAGDPAGLAGSTPARRIAGLRTRIATAPELPATLNVAPFQQVGLGAVCIAT